MGIAVHTPRLSSPEASGPLDCATRPRGLARFLAQWSRPYSPVVLHSASRGRRWHSARYERTSPLERRTFAHPLERERRSDDRQDAAPSTQIPQGAASARRRAREATAARLRTSASPGARSRRIPCLPSQILARLAAVPTTGDAGRPTHRVPVSAVVAREWSPTASQMAWVAREKNFARTSTAYDKCSCFNAGYTPIQNVFSMTMSVLISLPWIRYFCSWK